MTYQRYCQYCVDVGPKWARNMALSCGVTWAQVELWYIRWERERLAALEKQAIYDAVR